MEESFTTIFDRAEGFLPNQKGECPGIPPRIDRCVHDLIEQQTCVRPEAQAVCSWDGNLTYSSLHKLSLKLAHYLRRIGAGPEIIIPFCFEKSLWAVVAAVAILKSGSAFVALDPSTPKNRLASIIQDTGSKIIVTSPSQAALFETFSGHAVVVSSTFIDCLQEINEKPCTEVSPKNSAFILFTSGSTGKYYAVGLKVKVNTVIKNGLSG